MKIKEAASIDRNSDEFKAYIQLIEKLGYARFDEENPEEAEK